ncbi:unnamed protein product, partial [Menidia menidia]
MPWRLVPLNAAEANMAVWTWRKEKNSRKGARRGHTRSWSEPMDPSSVLLLLLGVSGVLLLDNRPNFVLMMVDDLGIGDLGCYGNDTLRTFFSLPGIAGHSRPGVFLFNAASGGLPSREVTFATIAKQQGYETALIGKWHLGLNCETRDDHCHHPSVHGFKYFFGIPLTNLRDCQPGHGTVFQLEKYLPLRTFGIILASAVVLHFAGFLPVPRGVLLVLLMLVATLTGLVAGFIKMMPYLNCLLYRNHDIVEQPFASENMTQRMTREAVDFIERNSARPFLLFFSFLQVHTAMFASAAFRGTSRHGIYGDAVHEVDWSV